MATQNYSLAWEHTQEIATHYNQEVKTVVIGVDSIGFYALSLFTESLAGESGSTPIDICSALKRVETWMYGYCTAYSQQLAQ